MLEKLSYYLQYDFVRYALVAGVLIALCAALLGVTLVLRRYSLIGDGLSHVAFGATTVAMVFSVAPLYVSLPATVAASVLLLRGGRSKLGGDSGVAVISVSSLALGYLVLNLFSKKTTNLSGDVCSILFGSTSILTLKKSDVVVCVLLTLLVAAVFALFYNKIFAVTFDESFTAAVGTKCSVYNTILAVTTAVVVVLAVNLVGALLISALIVFPALCSMRLFKSFRGVMLGAAVLSVVCAVGGILVAILYSTPVGSTIVAFELAVFIICIIIDVLKGGTGK